MLKKNKNNSTAKSKKVIALKKKKSISRLNNKISKKKTVAKADSNVSMEEETKIKETKIKEKSFYINKHTQDCIVEYCKENTPQSRREFLFKNGIQKPFEKLIENVIYNYNFSGMDDYSDMKNELLSHMIIHLGKYNPELGSVFSYFNTAVRNQLLSKRKKERRFISIDEDDHYDSMNYESKANGSVNAIIQDNYMRDEQRNEFHNDFLETIKEKILDLSLNSKNIKERQFYLAILTIMDSYHDINISSSKHVHVMIRDLTNLSSKDISSLMRKLKVAYSTIRIDFLNEHSSR